MSPVDTLNTEAAKLKRSTAVRAAPRKKMIARRLAQIVLGLILVVGTCWAAFWALVLMHQLPPNLIQKLYRAAASSALASRTKEIPRTPIAVSDLQGQPAHPQLGINLSGLEDWNTELPFVDVFKLSREWISQRAGQPWGSGPALALDRHGWVTRLDSQCWVETPVCTIEGGHYPAGSYTLLYEGEGEIDVWGSASVVSRDPGKLMLDVQSAKGGFFLKLKATNPANYVRNIRVVMPGFLDQYRENPWNPIFLKRWAGMACIRFMDWMGTNGSKIRSWSDRPQPEDATYTLRGAPAEVMFDLCNRLKSDAWICIPHRADDDFIRQFAQMAREKLAPAQKIYVEYSNEVWNSGFEQCHFAIEEGRRLGLGGKPWEGGWKYTAKRSVEVFKIWKEVFGEGPRLVRILPSQAANSWVSGQILEYQDAYRSADALAVAPYITFTISPEPEGDDPAAKVVGSWTVEQLLDQVERVKLPQAIAWMHAQHKTAQEHGLRMVAYEAGQHLVGIRGAENDQRLTQLLLAANAHPRMKEIYAKYLQAWIQEGGDLLCHFNSVGRWSKWGSWGLLQYGDEDPGKSAKFAAAMLWAKALGQPVSFPQ